MWARSETPADLAARGRVALRAVLVAVFVLASLHGKHGGIGGVIAPAGANAGELACVGDCDRDGEVPISDLLVGVNIALGRFPVFTCRDLDENHDMQVTIGELILAVNNALRGCGVGNPLQRGLANLEMGDLIAANGAFSAAVAEDPSDARAILHHAATRLVTTVLNDARARDLLARAGFDIDGDLERICFFDVGRPDEVPPTAPRTTEFIDTARDVLLPEIQLALDSLATIPEEAIIAVDFRRFPRCMGVPRRMIEVDRGDILALTAALHAAIGVANLFASYDLDTDLDTLLNSTAQELIESTPNLLTRRSGQRLADARVAFRAAINSVTQAIDAILNEQDDQTNDGLTIVPVDRDDAVRVQQGLGLVRQALDRQVVFPRELGFQATERLNLNRLFAGQLQSLRRLVPGFDDDGDLDIHEFPDPTFAGITPDLTRDDIEQIIRGGDQCAVCETAADCQYFGVIKRPCSPCLFDCTGTVMRCSDGDFCADGFF